MGINTTGTIEFGGKRLFFCLYQSVEHSQVCPNIHVKGEGCAPKPNKRKPVGLSHSLWE